MSLRAQRILVADGDGTPIPYVTVTAPQGKFIAGTDIGGWLESVGENTTIHLSQVAYKPLTVAMADIKDGRITLDEAGNGRQIIADSICQLGYIYWNVEERTRTVSFNLSTYVTPRVHTMCF